jgi:hypothetical protein
MATFRTRRELIDAVLDNLGVLVPGQAPSNEEVSRVDVMLDPAFAEFAALGSVYVADPGTQDPPTGGQIDLATFGCLSDLLADWMAGAFNQAGNPSLKALAIEAEETLRRIGRPASTRATLKTDWQLRGGRRYAPFNFRTGV